MEEVLYNLAYERSILSSIIFNPEILDEVMERLKPDHLYLSAHHEIYQSMIDLKRMDYPIDEEFIRQELIKKKKFDERTMIDVLTSNAIANIDQYLYQVVERYRLRQLLHIATAIKASVLENCKNSDSIIGELESSILHLDEGAEDEIQTFYDLMLYYDHNPPPPGIVTGVSFADEGVGGEWDTGNLVTISGDPEAGKTIFTMQMLKEISYREPVGMFAFEFTTRMLIKMQQKSDHEYIKNIPAMQNMKVISKGFDISDIERNVKKLVRKGVRVFGIDSQMRIENAHFSGFTMEERETEKFSRLAKLAQKMDILIFMIIQTTDAAPDRPLGSKKGAHEASVMIRLKREKPKEGEEHKERRKYIVHKNKISGQHFEKDIVLNPFTLKFTRPYGEGGNEVKYTGHIPVEHKDASGKTTGQSAMSFIGDQLGEIAGEGKIDMAQL